MTDDTFINGRGSQSNPKNKFLKAELDLQDTDFLDEAYYQEKPKLELFNEHPKKILSTYESPDVPGDYSVNPYQGCEHGCVYCYARESHQYWGFSAGLDFETKIVVKKNAPELLRETFRKKSYRPGTIMLSGNTDCYQPIERKLEITRQLLKVMLEFRNPVGIITKNTLIGRDMAILQELAHRKLVHVTFSLTTLDESLRRVLEPRTASAEKKLKVMEAFAQAGIPTAVMVAPVIPG